jgi:lipopolysaccharide export system protein LptA
MRDVDRTEIKWPLLIVVLFVVCGVMSPAASEPEGTEAREQTGVAPPIHITADRVESDHRTRWVEFIGTVRATQQDVVITADRIKVFYEPGGDPAAAATAIEQIISQGNVKIVFDKKTKTAVAEKAVYTTADKVLVLTGGDPTVRSGKNSIRGEKITLFQLENRAFVEGNEKQQVEATFFTEGEGGLIQ